MKSRFFFFGNEGIPVIFYLTRLIPLNTCTPTHMVRAKQGWGIEHNKTLGITRSWQYLMQILWSSHIYLWEFGNLEDFWNSHNVFGVGFLFFIFYESHYCCCFVPYILPWPLFQLFLLSLVRDILFFSKHFQFSSLFFCYLATYHLFYENLMRKLFFW